MHRVCCFSASCVAMGMAPRTLVDLIKLCPTAHHTHACTHCSALSNARHTYFLASTSQSSTTHYCSLLLFDNRQIQY